MKVVVSDLDGTLYKDLNSLELNKEAVDLFRSMGNLFVIATGRNLTSLLTVLERVKFKCDYYICNDGAKIYDNNFNLLYSREIAKEVVLNVINLMGDNNCILEWNLDNGSLYTKNIDEEIVAINGKIVSYQESLKLLEKIIETIPQVRGYLSRYYINIVSRDVNKASSIDYLLKRLLIDRSFVYTIGDNVNDFEMLLEFNGSKMINSVPSLDLLKTKEYENVRDLIEEITFD